MGRCRVFLPARHSLRLAGLGARWRVHSETACAEKPAVGGARPGQCFQCLRFAPVSGNAVCLGQWNGETVNAVFRRCYRPCSGHRFRLSRTRPNSFVRGRRRAGRDSGDLHLPLACSRLSGSDGSHPHRQFPRASVYPRTDDRHHAIALGRRRRFLYHFLAYCSLHPHPAVVAGSGPDPLLRLFYVRISRNEKKFFISLRIP